MSKSTVGISDCKNEKEGWILTTWTDQQWTYVFRHKDKRIRAYIAAQAIYAAKNDKIWYDVIDRLSFWDQLQRSGFRAGNITVSCNADHASSVAAIVRGAGTILNNVKILSHVTPNMTARNAKDMLTKGGFSYTNDQGYVLSDGYLQAGDILWKQSHMAIVTGNGRDYLEDAGNNGLGQFLDTVNAHLGEDNVWTRAMLGEDVLLPNQAWDAAYITACAKQNGLIDVVFAESTNSKGLIDKSVKKGLGKFYNGPANGNTKERPKVGDVIAFTYKEGVEVSHVGVVTNVHKDDITVISGDVEHKVDSSTVQRTWKSIRGYYRPSWPDDAFSGSSVDPGDWIGDSSADLYYDRKLSLVREVGYTNDSGNRSLGGGKYRLGVVNYTQLLEIMGMSEGGMGGEGGTIGEGLSDIDLAAFTELGDVGGIQESLGQLALAQVGKAYVSGSKGPNAFDCSGLISYLYSQHGMTVGTSTAGILSVGKANNTIVMNSRNYNINSLAIGDIIITSSASSPTGRHAVMYLGNGKVISASGVKTGVVTRNVTNNAASILGVVRPLLRR